MRLIDADKIDFSTVFKGASDFAQDTRNAAQTLIEAQPTVDIKKQIYAELEAHKKLIEDGAGGEYVVELAQIADVLGKFDEEPEITEDIYQLLEASAEEIKNLYGRETALTERIRAMMDELE